MDTFTSILQRRSYRGRYQALPVPRENLRKIMEAGLAAPSGCNKQTTSLIAVDDPSVLARVLAVIDPPIAQTAPAAICVLTQRKNAYRDKCFAVQDYAAAIENMLLAITALGYSSCWYEGHITDDDRICDKIAAVLNVPEGYDLVALLPVGIAERPAAAPKKRSFEERAWFNTFPTREIRRSPYREEDYDAVCTFLAELNHGDTMHINWNWARWEWMYLHDEMDRSLLGQIPLWWSGDRIVGAALYDMYPGEACALWLPEYKTLAGEILEAAWSLHDENGLGIAVNVRDLGTKRLMKQLDYAPAEVTENLMRCDLNLLPHLGIPAGFTMQELDATEGARQQWLLWQGFDHGNDRAECLANTSPVAPRKHFRKELNLALVDKDGRDAALCSCWFLEGTGYAYVEPVCVIPEYRSRGLGRALLTQALTRCHALGAEYAYVISDLDFYRSIGFRDCERYQFWWKK